MCPIQAIYLNEALRRAVSGRLRTVVIGTFKNTLSVSLRMVLSIKRAGDHSPQGKLLRELFGKTIGFYYRAVLSGPEMIVGLKAVA